MKHLLCILLLCSSTMVQAQSYQEYVKMAMEALEKDSLHQAEALFRKALEKDPAIKSNAILFDYLGQIQERRGELKDALDSYSMGHNISPTTLSILLNRASLYMRMNNENQNGVDFGIFDYAKSSTYFVNADFTNNGRNFKAAWYQNAGVDVKFILYSDKYTLVNVPDDDKSGNNMRLPSTTTTKLSS